jgi:hypothetical protein
MICGGMMMELGCGFLEVLLEIKMKHMASKDFLHPPIFLQTGITQLNGLIIKEIFGYLVEFS